MSFKPQNAVVWAELPVSDLPKAVEFYATVFQYDLSIDDNGPNPIAMLPMGDGKGVAGHLYPGKPAQGAGPTIHLAVPDQLESAVERFRDAGGQILGEPIPLPVGRFAYGLDPDGNSIGLFEMAA